MSIDEIVKPVLINGLLTAAEWYRSGDPGYLHSIFDQVGFIDRNLDREKYYALPAALSSKVRYPVKGLRDEVAVARKETLSEIEKKHNGFALNYLDKLTSNQLYFLLEKFGANIPADVNGEVALFDRYKLLAAEVVNKANQGATDPADKMLIHVDISGIQKFIYNIVSKGALKNLRARSFFVELLSHHVIARIIRVFNLHQANILMNGGGNVHILSHCPEDYEDRLKEIDHRLNKWLLGEFNGLLHVAFCAVPWQTGGTIEDVLDCLSERVFEQKYRKFGQLVERGELTFVEDADPGYERCEVCYKDGHAAELREVREDGGKGTGDYRCPLCDMLVKLGKSIPETRFIYACGESSENCIRIEDVYYKLSTEREHLDCRWVVYDDRDDFLDDLGGSARPILAHNYTKRFSELPEQVQQNKNRYEDADLAGIATLEQMADSATGAKFIGALRMDADNMGKILRHGFYEGVNLEALSAFSRNVSYFFRLYLDSICRQGFSRERGYDFLKIRQGGRIVQVIYAGGDDLFAIGAWDDAAALAVDIGGAFRSYTCNSIDVGISAGLTLHQSRFPVVKMAEESAAALDCAKHELQPCWMCRAEWPNCPLLDNGVCLRKNAFAPFYTGYLAYRKREIDERHKTPRYREHSSRLTLALKWKRRDEAGATDEVDQLILQPLATLYKARSALRKGFFHNSLQLLETWYDEGVLYLPRLVWSVDKIRQELKRKQEGQEGESLYDLLMMHLHMYSPDQREGNKKFATLHMPLSWIILLERGGARNGEN